MFNPIKMYFLDTLNNKIIEKKEDLNKDTLLLLSISKNHSVVKSITDLFYLEDLYLGDIFFNKVNGKYYIVSFDKYKHDERLITGFSFSVYNNNLNFLKSIELNHFDFIHNKLNFIHEGNIFKQKDKFNVIHDDLYQNIYNIFLKFYKPYPLQINLIEKKYEKFFDYRNEFEIGVVYKGKKDYNDEEMLKEYQIHPMITSYKYRNKEEYEDGNDICNGYYYISSLTGDLFLINNYFKDDKVKYIERIKTHLLKNEQIKSSQIEEVIESYNNAFIGFDDNLNISFQSKNVINNFLQGLSFNYAMELFNVYDAYTYKKYDDLLLQII